MKMKNYQISFYTKSIFSGVRAVYYRQFENKKQATEWAKTFIDSDTTYTSYVIVSIPLHVYLENA